MGRWKLHDEGPKQTAAGVKLATDRAGWSLKRTSGAGPYASSDPDTQRIWWSEVGVHQNLTFPVHPDPVSGMHCWHQAVRVTKAAGSDAYGDIAVDTEKAHAVYEAWMSRTRGARANSPDGTLRPYWMLRPLKPPADAYVLPPAPLPEPAAAQ